MKVCTYMLYYVREEFEEQIMHTLLSKFEINKDISKIEKAVKKNGLKRLNNIKTSLLELKFIANKQMLFFLLIKAKLLELVYT